MIATNDSLDRIRSQTIAEANYHSEAASSSYLWSPHISKSFDRIFPARSKLWPRTETHSDEHSQYDRHPFPMAKIHLKKFKTDFTLPVIWDKGVGLGVAKL
jgi:hypothetical protein